MPFDVHCTSCVRSFPVASNSSTAELLERMADNGAWCPLGDGETIEDNVYRALAAEPELCCPDCSQPLTISQETLGRFARALLVQW